MAEQKLEIPKPTPATPPTAPIPYRETDKWKAAKAA
jgi:hypothetical protein